MKTFKRNIVVLENDDRIEVEFRTPDLDKSKCSISINPSEGEIVLTFGDFKVVANSIPAVETWGAFYFPVKTSLISPDHPDMDDGDFGIYLCRDHPDGIESLEHTEHRGVKFLTFEG